MELAGVDVRHKAKGTLTALELAKKRKRELASGVTAAFLAEADPTAVQVPFVLFLTVLSEFDAIMLGHCPTSTCVYVVKGANACITRAELEK